MNSLLKFFGTSKRKDEWDRPTSGLLTTSVLPGTTLSALSFSLSDGTHIFDTPGVVNSRQLPNIPPFQNRPREWPFLFPNKKIKPRFFKVSEGRSMLIGGIARIDVEFVRSQVHPAFFTCYFSDSVDFHLTGTERADQYRARYAGLPGLRPPTTPQAADALLRLPHASHSHTITGGPDRRAVIDVCLQGLGWVSVAAHEGDVVRVRVTAPQQLGVDFVDPLMPYELENRKHWEIRRN